MIKQQDIDMIDRLLKNQLKFMEDDPPTHKSIIQRTFGKILRKKKRLFGDTIIPVVRRLYPNLISKQITDIQPIQTMTGYAFGKIEKGNMK